MLVQCFFMPHQVGHTPQLFTSRKLEDWFRLVQRYSHERLDQLFPNKTAGVLAVSNMIHLNFGNCTGFYHSTTRSATRSVIPSNMIQLELRDQPFPRQRWCRDCFSSRFMRWSSPSLSHSFWANWHLQQCSCAAKKAVGDSGDRLMIAHVYECCSWCFFAPQMIHFNHSCHFCLRNHRSDYGH